MLKKLLFVVVTIAIVLGSFASALIVPRQASYRIEAADSTPTPIISTATSTPTPTTATTSTPIGTATPKPTLTPSNNASQGDLIDYSKIKLLEWTGPGKPGTYEEYIQAHEQFQPQEPLIINSVSSVTNTVILPGTTVNPRVLFIVNSSLYPYIETRFNRYVTDAQSNGYEVATYLYASGTAEELKSYIVSHSQNLTGCIFVGSIPAAWYEIDSDSFPCDLFYMDLDGTWTDADHNGIYENHSAGSGDEGPEIFVARIDASTVPGDEATVVNSYFDKLHNYYNGTTQRTMYGLTYTEDDWADELCFAICIGSAYTNYQAILAPNTSRDDYVNNRLASTAYDFIQLACHSGSSSHGFVRGEWLFSDDVRNVPPEALFYNLFCCSALRFTDPNCLGNAYIFNTGGRGLSVVGSTKGGGMIIFSNFYTPLGQGKSFGEAFKEWFDSLASHYTANVISWSFGMTILGDPLAVPIRAAPSTTLSVTASPVEGGSPSGAGSYYSGSVVTIDANANAGYQFVNWTGTGVDAGKVANSASATTTITMDANYSVQANFVFIGCYTLTASSSKGGTVAIPGMGTFNCSYNSNASLVAIPNDCYRFVNWTGTGVTASKVANPNSPSTIITMSTNYSVQANFAISTYSTLTTSSSVGGKVTSPGQSGTYTYNCGTNASLVAVANDCYRFVNWTGTGVTAGKVANPNSSSTTINMSGNYTVQANFYPHSHSTLNTSSSTGGTVTTPGIGNFSYPCGSGQNLVATPSAHCYFSGWTGTGVDAGAVANPNAALTIIAMRNNYSIAANFQLITHTVTVSATTGGQITSGVGSFAEGSVVALTAIPIDYGYQFVNWSGDTQTIANPNSSNTTITVNADYTVQANFKARWSSMTSGTTVQLNSVWGSNASNVFAVGTSGNIRYYNGNAWSKMTSGITGLFPPSLNSVWGSNSSNVFAVGASGTIRKYNGTSWTGMTSGTTKNLWGVWGTGPNDVFAVGDSGTVLHYNGSAWSTMSSSVTAALHGIWGSSFDNVFAAGASGKIIQYK